MANRQFVAGPTGIAFILPHVAYRWEQLIEEGALSRAFTRVRAPRKPGNSVNTDRAVLSPRRLSAEDAETKAYRELLLF